jgi:hypothetical protein
MTKAQKRSARGPDKAEHQALCGQGTREVSGTTPLTSGPPLHGRPSWPPLGAGLKSEDLDILPVTGGRSPQERQDQQRLLTALSREEGRCPLSPGAARKPGLCPSLYQEQDTSVGRLLAVLSRPGGRGWKWAEWPQQGHPGAQHLLLH